MISAQYDEGNIRHLSDMEHIRTRPGMYIGRLGDGSQPEDGIYVLLKEVIDNSIDEFKMGAGKRIEVDIEDNLRITVRDYGRGIPQGKLVEAVSMLNTGGKYDSKAFQKSVGLNGVGLKAVNALSTRFEVQSFRDGQVRRAVFSKGILEEDVTEATQDESGTAVFFEPDASLFKHYAFRGEFVEVMLRNYTYLNTGLTIMFNGRRILSRDGLSDLLSDRMDYDPLYPIIHLKGEDIEIAFTHTKQNGEEYYSFVNGATSMVCVPVTCKDLERASVVIEALASGAYKTITPVLYETYLKRKVTRDADSADMIEYIVRNRVFDMGYVNLFDGIGSFVREMLTAKKTDVSYTFQKYKRKSQSDMEKLVESYKKSASS